MSIHHNHKESRPHKAQQSTIAQVDPDVQMPPEGDTAHESILVRFRETSKKEPG